MRRLRPKHVGWAAILLVVGALGTVGAYLVTGRRYMLYANRQAARCWRGIERLALPTSSLRPRRVDGPSTSAHGATRVAIEYRMDDVLGGLPMRVECVYGPSETVPRSVTMNGVRVGRKTLERIDEGLAR